MDEAGLRQLLALGGQRRWKKGEAMFRAGDPVGPFFKITKGVAVVSRSLDDGRRQIVLLRARGDCLGYLDKSGRHAFDGEALTDVEACAFDRRRFDVLSARHPDLATAVMEMMASALWQSGRMLMVLGQFQSTERVAHFFAELHALYGNAGVPPGSLCLQMKRSQIAEYLGLRMETVSRAIGKLRKNKVIDVVESDEIVVLDPERLREVGKFAD